MIENKQKIVDKKKGDCFRACVTSILELPNDPSLPNIDDINWRQRWDTRLRQFGIYMIFDYKKIWKEGYWIASVPSKNLPGCSHAIVMKGHKVAFDPSTKKRYRKGRDLLGAGLVKGGYSFEIIDVSLLPRLEKYREYLNNK